MAAPSVRVRRLDQRSSSGPAVDDVGVATRGLRTTIGSQYLVSTHLDARVSFRGGGTTTDVYWTYLSHE